MYGGSRADPLRVRRFFLGGLAAGIVVMSVTGLAAVSLISTPGQVAARSAAPPGSVITAPVRWEVLRDAITTQGIVTAARTVTVTAAAPYRTVTVTKMPVKAGKRVRPGQVIAEIDGRPVILLEGRLPAYRDLRQGDHGPDVSQLQADLARLGYADFDPAGFFGPSTSLALLLFYRHLGYQAPVYRPPGAARGGRQGAPIPPRRAVAAPIPAAYLPMSEVAYIPARSALVVWVGARVGSVVGNGPVLRLAVGHPFVTGALSPHQAALARKGMAAQIVSASPALTVAGRVSRIGSRPAVGGRPAAYPVWVRTRRALAQRLVGAPVRLTIWAPVTAGPVLVVPITAVFAAPAGNGAYVVRVAAGRRRRIRIFTGPSADGTIAVRPVRPGGLSQGDRVLVAAGR